MDISQFGGMGITVYLIAQFGKRAMKTEGALVLVLVLLLGIGLSEVEVITTLSVNLTRQAIIRAFLDGFYRGVLVAAVAAGIHGTSQATKDAINVDVADVQADTVTVTAPRIVPKPEGYYGNQARVKNQASSAGDAEATFPDAGVHSAEPELVATQENDGR